MITNGRPPQHQGLKDSQVHKLLPEGTHPVHDRADLELQHLAPVADGRRARATAGRRRQLRAPHLHRRMPLRCMPADADGL